MPRPPLGPAEPSIELAEAARRLGVTRATLHERVRADDPVIRGLAPRSELNPTSRWLVSLDDVEAELRRKGRLEPVPAPPPAEPSVDAMRVQMLQGALNDEKDRRIEEMQRRIAQLESLAADKDTQIARLEMRLAALGQAVSGQLQAAALTVAAATGAPTP